MSLNFVLTKPYEPCNYILHVSLLVYYYLTNNLVISVVDFEDSY